MEWKLGILGLLLCVACGDGKKAGPAVRIEVSPSNTMLLAGESFELDVVGYDENDNAISVDATWSSDDAATISVDSGRIESEAGVGSATISASVGDLSASAFVYVADPVPGAVLFSDDQVTEEPVGLVRAPDLVGTTLRLGLRGVDVEVGNILLPRGITPAMGRVTAIDGESVTLEIVSLSEAFFNLDIDQEVTQVFDDPVELESYRADDLPDGTSAHAGLSCEFEGEGSFSPSFPNVDADPTATWANRHRIVDGEKVLSRVAVFAEAALTFDGEFQLPAQLMASFTCEHILWRLPIHGVGGPLGTLLIPKVPLGYGLSGTATVQANAFTVKFEGPGTRTAKIGANLLAGIEWDPEGNLSPVFDPSLVNDLKLTVDTGTEGSIGDLAYSFEAKLFAVSGLDVHNRFSFVSDSTEPLFELLDFNAGFVQDAEFASLASQAVSDTFASNYKLAGFAELKTGKSITALLKFFNITDEPFGPELTSDPFTTSPTGSIGVVGTVEVDTAIPLTVTLQNTDYLGVYNVYAVRIWRELDDGTWDQIAEELNVADASPGKTNFTFNWTPPVGVYAPGDKVKLLPTVETLLLPLLDIEPADDARRELAFSSVDADAPTRILFASDRDGDQEIYVMNGDGTNQVNLSNSAAGADRRPAGSPDGTQIAFSSNRDGNEEIYVMDEDGSNQVNLSNDASLDRGPVWSPDGTQIAFTSSRGGSMDIWVMDADGSNPQNLSNNLAADAQPSWSPDGSMIAFISDRHVGNNQQVYVMNADGSGVQRISNTAFTEGEPSWSPDGLNIVFHTDNGNLEVFVMSANGANPQNLTANAASDDKPDWSPDGNSILFQSARDGKAEIYLMDADGTNPQNLSDDAGFFDFDPSWFPTPSRVILFSRFVDFNNNEIFSMNPDGSNQQNLTNTAGNDWWQSLSPDGTKIVFSSRRDGNDEIYVMNANGSNQQRLTTNTANDEEPTWSPDGTKIAFTTDRDGDWEIYVMDANGANQTNISNDLSDDESPAWSPNGLKLAFTTTRDGNSEVYSMDANGANPLNLTNNAGGDLHPTWSPDGTAIAFSSLRLNPQQIFVMDANGSNQSPVGSGGSIQDWPSYSPSGTQLVFSSLVSGTWDIFVMDTLDGSNLMNLSNNVFSDQRPSWTP